MGRRGGAAALDASPGPEVSRARRALALPAQLGELAVDPVEPVLDLLEPLGEGAQPAREPVDVVAGGQVQVADRARPGLRGALTGAEGDLQGLVQPGVLDQELRQVAQRALPPRRDTVPDAFAAALVHIVPRHGTALGDQSGVPAQRSAQHCLRTRSSTLVHAR